MLSTLLLQDVHTLVPCSHEEADSRVLLHVSRAAQHGYRQMLTRTVDIDVVVLAVFSINHLPAGYELWLAFGTGNCFRYLTARQIDASLGPDMSCALPMFPCFDRLRHCIQLCWTWKEDSMVNMEVTAGTDRCTIGACRWTKGDPRWCSEHN